MMGVRAWSVGIQKVLLPNQEQVQQKPAQFLLCPLTNVSKYGSFAFLWVCPPPHVIICEHKVRKVCPGKNLNEEETICGKKNRKSNFCLPVELMNLLNRLRKKWENRYQNKVRQTCIILEGNSSFSSGLDQNKVDNGKLKQIQLVPYAP